MAETDATATAVPAGSGPKAARVATSSTASDARKEDETDMDVEATTTNSNNDEESSDNDSDDNLTEVSEEARKAAALAHKEAGNVKFKAKDYYGSIDLYNLAVETAPEIPVYYLNRAAARMQVSQLDGAAKDCERAIELDPVNLKAHLRLVKCFLKRGKLEEAVKACDRTLVLSPKHVEATRDKKDAQTQLQRVTRARQCIAQKDYSTALQMTSAGLRHSPESRVLNMIKAEAMANMGDLDLAYALTTKLMRDDQNDNNLLFVRARVLYLQENFASAIKHLRQALNSDPDNSKYQLEIKRLIKLDRSKEEGNKAFKAGRLKDAIELYTKCLELAPENKAFCSKVHANRAAANMKLGRNEDALMDVDRAIELNKDYGKAYMRRAQILRAMGGKENLERATFDYTEAERILGRSQEIRRALQETKVELKKAKRKDYYTLMNVPNRENANEAEIKKCYKKAALKWHPDRHTRGTDEEKLAAEAMFKDISEGYAVLTDPRKKEQYDHGMDIEEIDQGGGHGHSHGGGGGFGGHDPNDIFRAFFAQQGGGMGGGGGGGFHFG